jgi:uncharacterized SAM-binding protein YcdF (DUF218 family)
MTGACLNPQNPQTENPQAPPGGRKAKRRGIIALAILLALALLCLGAYWFSPQVLSVDSGAVKADVIVVLGGDISTRPEYAAALFRQGCAPDIIVSGGKEYREILLDEGVPESAIHLETESRNTMENAKFSIPILKRMGARRVIIVTSWYHSRRALKCFEKVAPDIAFYPRPAYAGMDRAEWSRNGVGTHIRAEYVKMLGYWVRYGVCPF